MRCGRLPEPKPQREGGEPRVFEDEPRQQGEAGSERRLFVWRVTGSSVFAGKGGAFVYRGAGSRCLIVSELQVQTGER